MTAAMDEMLASKQVTIAQMDFNDHDAAQTAADAAYADWQDAIKKATDANNQEMMAESNPVSVPTEETPALMRAIMDAKMALDSANASRDQAKIDKDAAQDAADKAFSQD